MQSLLCSNMLICTVPRLFGSLFFCRWMINMFACTTVASLYYFMFGFECYLYFVTSVVNKSICDGNQNVLPILWSKSVEENLLHYYKFSFLRVQNDIVPVTMMWNTDVCAELLECVPRVADYVSSTSHLQRAAAGPHSNRCPLQCAVTIAIVDMAADMSSDQLQSNTAHPAVYERRLGGACGKKQPSKDTIRRI